MDASGAMDRTGWPGQAFCDFVATMRPGGRVEPGQLRLTSPWAEDTIIAAPKPPRSGRWRAGHSTAHHHRSNDPSDGPLAVGVGADQLGHVADRRSSRFDLPAFGG